MKYGRNEPCPCGSGRKYKSCHLPRGGFIHPVLRVAPPKDSGLSLFDRNNQFLDSMIDIFGLRNRQDWRDIKNNIRGDQIAALYKSVANLWPLTTNIEKLLPPTDSKLRALYLGDVNPKEILRNTSRFGLYADEILIVNPFQNPWCVGEEYNPIKHPDQYKFDTVKLVASMVLLEPWLRMGLVQMIPDPGDFNYQLRKETWLSAEKRLKKNDIDERDLKDAIATGKEQMSKIFYSLPEAHWEARMRDDDPNADDETIKAVLAELKRLRREDPFAIDQSIEQLGAQLTISRSGANLEMATIICGLTGAFPYTNLHTRWKELHSTSSGANEESKTWSPLTQAFQQLDFSFLDQVDPTFACNLRRDGRLSGFRSYLRRVWMAASKDAGEIPTERSREFTDELKQEYSRAKTEWNEIDQKLSVWLTKGAGLALGGGALLQGGLTLSFALLGAGALTGSQLLQSYFTRKKFRQNAAMSVLIDLSRNRQSH